MTEQRTPDGGATLFRDGDGRPFSFTQMEDSDDPMTGTQDALVVRIEMTPPYHLGPNSRLHWRAKNRIKQSVQMAAMIGWNEAKGGCHWFGTDRLTIGWEIVYGHGEKQQDDDNVIGGYCKAVRDVFCAQMSIDDRNVRTGTVTHKRVKNQPGWVTATIRRTETE